MFLVPWSHAGPVVSVVITTATHLVAPIGNRRTRVEQVVVRTTGARPPPDVNEGIALGLRYS